MANDQYYWRVRPVDNFGNKRDWNAVTTWTFRRHWPDQPDLEYPENDSTVGDPFFYQWKPVDHASEYTIQLSRSSDFNALVDACSTVHTTYVPTKNTDCWPGAAGTYFWRVIATDAPGETVDGDDIVTDRISAEVGRFTYYPTLVAPQSPANGATVFVPTLRWSRRQRGIDVPGHRHSDQRRWRWRQLGDHGHQLHAACASYGGQVLSLDRPDRRIDRS